MHNNQHGLFITLEGIDGSGKSTQARRLSEHLTARGLSTHLTREPGGSPGAEDIRRLLVEGDPGRWSPETEILLFMAARRDHLERVITPMRNAGTWVISDRFADSTRVYQGAARAELRGFVDRLHELVIATEPDLTLVIDMDPEVALARGLARQSGEDRFEEFGIAFQHKLREGFLALPEQFPDRCHLINGNQSEDKVAAQIAALIDGINNG